MRKEVKLLRKEAKQMPGKKRFERLKKSVIDMDGDDAKAAANEAIAQNMDPIECIEKGLAKGMQVISDMFDDGEVYVPQIILSRRGSNSYNIPQYRIQRRLIV